MFTHKKNIEIKGVKTLIHSINRPYYYYYYKYIKKTEKGR